MQGEVVRKAGGRIKRGRLLLEEEYKAKEKQLNDELHALALDIQRKTEERDNLVNEASKEALRKAKIERDIAKKQQELSEVNEKITERRQKLAAVRETYKKDSKLLPELIQYFSSEEQRLSESVGTLQRKKKEKDALSKSVMSLHKEIRQLSNKKEGLSEVVKKSHEKAQEILMKAQGKLDHAEDVLRRAEEVRQANNAFVKKVKFYARRINKWRKERGLKPKFPDV